MPYPQLPDIRSLLQKRFDAWLKMASPLNKEKLRQLDLMLANPSSERNALVLPKSLLKRPKVLKELFARGLNPAQIQCPQGLGVRQVAFREDSPWETHDLLNDFAVDTPSEKEAGGYAADAIRKGHVNALISLHRMHPEFIESTMKGKNPGAMMALCAYLRQPTAKAHTIAQLAGDWGAEWPLMRGHLDRYPAQQETFEIFLREEQARALEKSTRTTNSLLAARPRPRI